RSQARDPQGRRGAPVLRSVGVYVPSVGPDRVRLVSLGDRETAVVAVETGLSSVRRFEGRRDDLEVKRHLEVRTAAEHVVAQADRVSGRAARLRRPAGEAAGRCRVLVGDTLRAVVADADVVAVALFSDVNSRAVVV